MSFTIYEGESAQRTRVMRLEIELRRTKEENARLRAKCGEAAVAEVTAELAAARLGEPQAVGAINGGNGSFVIGGAGGRKAAPVAMNPLVARARAGRAAAPTARAAPAIARPAAAPVAGWQPDDLPASTQPQEDEADASSSRFELLELSPR